MSRLSEVNHKAMAARVSCAPGTPATLVVSDVGTGEDIGALPCSVAADLPEAARLARQAQSAWSAVPPEFRRAALKRAADLIASYVDHLLDVLQAETGMSRRSALVEVAHVVRGIRLLAREGARTLRPAALRPFGRLTRHGHGIVAVIAEPNPGFAATALGTAAALMAGNAVLCRPPAGAPYSSLVLGMVLDAARVPAELFQVVVGGDPHLAAATARVADVVRFSGTPQAARTVAQACAERLIPFSVRPTGRNATLVLADADLDLAVSGVIDAASRDAALPQAGAGRILVSNPVFPAFCELLTTKVAHLRVGLGEGWEFDLGGLGSQAAFDQTMRTLDATLADGAALLTGGSARPDLGRWCLDPTVVCQADPTVVVPASGGALFLVSRQPGDLAVINQARQALTPSGHARIYSAQLSAAISADLPARTVALNPDPGQEERAEEYRWRTEALLELSRPRVVLKGTRRRPRRADPHAEARSILETLWRG